MRGYFVLHGTTGEPWIYIPEEMLVFTSFSKGGHGPFIAWFFAFQELLEEVDPETFEEHMRRKYTIVREMDVSDRIVRFICDRAERSAELEIYEYRLSQDREYMHYPERRAELVAEKRKLFNAWCMASDEKAISQEVEKLIATPRGLN